MAQCRLLIAALAGRSWHWASRPMTNCGRVIGMAFPEWTPPSTTRRSFMRRPRVGIGRADRTAANPSARRWPRGGPSSRPPARMDEAGVRLNGIVDRGMPPMQQECGRIARGILAAVLGSLAGCGCNGRPAVSPPPPPKWPGITLRVAAADGAPRLVAEKLGGGRGHSAGATLTIVPPTGEWPAADLVLVAAADLPRWAAAGKAAPLPRPEDVDAFMPLYRTRLLIW